MGKIPEKIRRNPKNSQKIESAPTLAIRTRLTHKRPIRIQ